MNQKQQAARKAIAWSTDALIPGIYVWFGGWSFRLGGTQAEESYQACNSSQNWNSDRAT